MVVSKPAASQTTPAALLRASSQRLLTALSVALLLWLVLVLVIEVNRLLLLVMAIQLACLLVSLQQPKAKSETKSSAGAILAGVLSMMAAVILGVTYDLVLRWLFGPGTATIGPWGEVRRTDFVPAAVILLVGVLIGPLGEERFFRAGLFGSWQAAHRPWTGAVLSSGFFALARLDLWNLLAYFGLGMVLCGVYRWTGRLLAVWIAHALLNAVMFAFLFCRYQ
jgi:membrane protease YdiL (CAAX protease family)